MTAWEDTFSSWAKGPGETEKAKCDNAITQIRKAISKFPALEGKNIEVLAQGSYKNNTNIRLDSDVDICILCRDTCFTNYSFASDLTDSDVGLSECSYPYESYKNDIEKALYEYFGSAYVKRGDKAFDVHANTYRVDADVVPCFELRRYMRDTNNKPYYIKPTGTAFLTDRDSRRIENWPQQNYDNGVDKNDKTGKRYKALIRIIKNMRNYMQDINISESKEIASFLIECLLWNVPNEGYGHDSYTDDIRYILAYTFNKTLNDEECKEWGEVNELKYLFRKSQPWDRNKSHAFLSAAWDIIGFNDK